MRWWLLATLVSLSSGCTLRPVVVHPVRIKVARPDYDSVPAGSENPNEFTKVWNFSNSDGYVFDVSKVEVTGGVVRHKLRGLAVFPYAMDRVVVETTDGQPFRSLDHFSEKLGAGHHGETRYQLSPDGMHWYFHDGRHWKWTKRSKPFQLRPQWADFGFAFS